jgi:hypothetical protein
VFELVIDAEDEHHLFWMYGARRRPRRSEVLFVGGSASVYLTGSEYFRGEADADCIYFADDNELPRRQLGEEGATVPRRRKVLRTQQPLAPLHASLYCDVFVMLAKLPSFELVSCSSK